MAAPNETSSASGDCVTAVIQTTHRNLKAFPFFPNAIGGRNTHIVAVDPACGASAHTQFIMNVARSDTSHVGFHHEGGDAVVGRLGVGIGLGKPENVVGFGRQTNPHLFAVDDVVVTVAAGRGTHGRHV